MYNAVDLWRMITGVYGSKISPQCCLLFLQKSIYLIDPTHTQTHTRNAEHPQCFTRTTKYPFYRRSRSTKVKLYNLTGLRNSIVEIAKMVKLLLAGEL